MSSTSQSLRALLNNADTVAALEGIYERQLQRILSTLADGLTSAGAARARELLAELRILVHELDPSRDSLVRQWIRENIPAAFVLGDEAATLQLQKELGQVSDADAEDFGALRSGFTAVNQTAMRAITSMMEETLKNAAADIQNTLGLAVRRTQLTLQTDAAIREAVIGGRVRGATGKQLADDIANVILQGGDPKALARLQELGFQPDLLQLYKRLAEGQFITINGRNYNVSSYAKMVARTMMSEAHKSGTIVRLQQNGVDHVKWEEHAQKEPDSCTLFMGNVFYIGAGEDPLGFPSLSTVPNHGVPQHPNCVCTLAAWVIQFKTKPMVDAARAIADALPDDVFGKTAREVADYVDQLTPAQFEEIAPRGAANLPDDYFQGPPPSKSAAA
ncbi:MAG TPA: hypothetical protein VG457_08260 [Planctomycetota bacterium]|jgi:hypothetical protein|nr:hypothetical protein [Planctomycetota bacterium]